MTAAPADPGDDGQYRRHREAAGRRQSASSRAGREIGELPAVVNPDRRAGCARNFGRYLLTYHPYSFPLPFSPDHQRVIARTELSMLEGGLFALAMPRGSGKTTISECACLWALLYGWQQFVALFGATGAAAAQMLDSVRSELEANDLLEEDFPEVCHPIRRLEGITQRRLLYRGEPVLMELTERRLVLPAIPGSQAAEGVLVAAGITGRIRGLKYKRQDGRSVRPGAVVIDDPQTDESANSVSQCATRERTLAGAILGLAGPKQKIAGIMPVTVIREGDVASRMLDRDLHPEWQGERMKMVYSFPADEELWDRYAELRADGLRRGDGGAEATEFYRDNRAAMDTGAVVAWPERFNPDELSAVQHAMNLKITDERSFFAEYQNEPLPEDLGENELTADQVAERYNRLARRLVPLSCGRLTCFIDVQQTLLFYCVCAWADDFTGAVVDYGAWPEQARAYFTLRDVRRTLASITKAPGLEGQLYHGLEALTAQVLGREWKREDGAALRVEKCLVDANWGQSTDVVYEFCRTSPYASVLQPSHGKFVGASNNPLTDKKKQPGERFGLNWLVPLVKTKRGIRHVLYDTNFWKSFTHARLSVAKGSRGALTLFGDNPQNHRLFSEHVTAEYRVKTEGRGRTVDEWKLRPHRPDNHWLDCLVGCAVAASVQGCDLKETPVGKKGPRKQVSYRELYEQAQQRQRGGK